jgi:hypothetical protein
MTAREEMKGREGKSKSRSFVAFVFGAFDHQAYGLVNRSLLDQ